MNDPTGYQNQNTSLIETFQSVFHPNEGYHYNQQKNAEITQIQDSQQSQQQYLETQQYNTNQVLKEDDHIYITHNAQKQTGQVSDSKISESDLNYGNCSSSGKNNIEVISEGSLLFAFVNFLLLFYIWCRKHFVRTEFWGVYIMNLIWSSIILVYIMSTANKVQQECTQTVMFQKAVVILVLKKELENIFALIMPRQFSTRQTNFGSNLIFPYLYLFSGNLGGCAPQSSLEGLSFEVCFVHFFILFMGSIFNLILTCMDNKKGTVFRFFVLLSTLIMLVLYIQNYSVYSSYANNTEVHCTKGKFIQLSYLIINPIGIFSMLCILCTILPGSDSNQKQDMLKEYYNNIQHQDYVYNTAKQSNANPNQILSMYQNQNKQMDMTKSYGTLFKK